MRWKSKARHAKCNWFLYQELKVYTLWTGCSFVGLPSIKAAASGVVCQVCHSTEVVFKAGVQTNISTALSPSQCSLCAEMSIEKRGNAVASICDKLVYLSNSWGLEAVRLPMDVQLTYLKCLTYFRNLVQHFFWNFSKHTNAEGCSECLWSKYIAIVCAVTYRWWLSPLLVAVTVNPWAATEQPDLWLCLLVHWSTGHFEPRWLPLSCLLPPS